MSSYDLWAKNGVHMQNCPVLCKEWWIPFGDFLKISWMLRKNKRIFVKTSKISEKALSHNTLQKTQKNQQSYKNYTEHRQMIAMFFLLLAKICATVTSTKSTLPQWLERSTSQPQLKKALEAKMVPKWQALREWWAKNWRSHKDSYMVVVHKLFWVLWSILFLIVMKVFQLIAVKIPHLLHVALRNTWIDHLTGCLTFHTFRVYRVQLKRNGLSVVQMCKW